MRKAAAFSVGLHVTVVVLTVLGLPYFKRDLEMPEPIVFEVVNLAETSNPPPKQVKAPEPKPEPPKPEPPKPEPPKPEPPKPEPAPEPPRPPEPKPEPPKPEPAKPAPPPDDLAALKPPVPKAKPKPPEPPKEPKTASKPEEKPKPKPDDFAESILKTLQKTENRPKPENPDHKARKPETAPMAAAGQVNSNAQVSDLSRQLSMSEKDAVRQQIAQCWNVDAGARGIRDMVVAIEVFVDPNRTVLDARIVDTGRYASDPTFRAVAESARRAVLNPRCSPLRLPPDKYESWKHFYFDFNPRDML